MRFRFIFDVLTGRMRRTVVNSRSYRHSRVTASVHNDVSVSPRIDNAVHHSGCFLLVHQEKTPEKLSH